MKTYLESLVWASLAGTLTLASACASPQPTAEPAKETDPAVIEKGRQTYAMFCQACHGPEDPSIDSPSNLFDATWHNGEGRSGVENSIRVGIVEKGMPAWGEMIPSEDIAALLDYLFSFQKPATASDE